MVQQRGAHAEPLFNWTIFFQLRNPAWKQHQMRMPLPGPLLRICYKFPYSPRWFQVLGIFSCGPPPWYTKKLWNFFFSLFWCLAESTNKNLGTISTELVIFLIFLQSSGTTQRAEGLQQIQKHSGKSVFSSIWTAPGYTVNKVNCSESFQPQALAPWAVSSAIIRVLFTLNLSICPFSKPT